MIEDPDLASEGENPIRPGRLGPDPSLSDPAKPEPAQADAAHRRAASEEVEMRRASGEFDGAIEAFETLPYEEYRKFVGHAVRHLDGNRYYVNLDGDLYVYSGGVDSEHHHFLRRLNRSSA